MTEIAALPFKPEIRQKFLRDNVVRIYKLKL